MIPRRFQTFLHTVQRWRTREQSIRQFMQINHRMLRDIGVEWGSIPSVVDALLARHGADGTIAAATDTFITAGSAPCNVVLVDEVPIKPTGMSSP